MKISAKTSHPARLPSLMITAAMLLALLLPVLDVAGQTIRTNPTPTPTEEWDPNLVAEPTAEPTREPERVPPTQVPTEEPQPAAPGSLTLHKGVCDDSAFDPSSASGLQSFLDACQSPDGEFEFTISNGAGFSLTAMTELGSLFTQLPTGPVTITETIPAGWGDPAVFCWSNLLPTPSGTPFIGNSPTWDVQEGEDVECWWFNVAGTPDPLHTIRASSLACPEGTDLTSDYWTLATTCVEPLTEVGFQVFTEGGTIGGPTDASGGIEFSGVDLGASGVIQIIEDIPDGASEPVVWCVSYPVEAADAQDFAFFPVESVDGTVTVEPERHEPFIFSCAYYHGAFADAPDDLVDPASAGDGLGNTISLLKYRCPLGAPYEDFGTDIFDYCTDPHTGIEFTLSASGFSNAQDTDASGQITWDGLPAGEFTIQETLVPGYEDTLVYCAWTEVPEGVMVEAGWLLTPSMGGTFVLDLPETGFTIHCGVFNLPRHESRIVVNKRICPTDVDFVLTDEYTIDDLLTACPAEGDGIEFTLDNAHGSSTQAIVDGATWWDGVPHGAFTLTESIPEGYGEPVWFCSVNPYDENGDLTGISGWSVHASQDGAIQDSIDEELGEIFACWVFNVPDPGTSSMTVVKWLCPEGFVRGVDDPLTECTELWDGVTFALGDMEAVTGSAGPGLATFLNVPPGEHALVETVPDGIAEGFFGSCYVNDAPVLLAIGLAAPPTLEIAIDEGDHWVCHVYNVPGEDNDIDLFKWVCPEGAGHEEDIDWYVDTCTEALDGITFAVTSDLGVAALDTVGGMVGFGGFAQGMEVGIQEDIPEEYGEPVVVCGIEGDWSIISAPTGGIEHTFDGFGQTLVCHWFNIPGEPPSITVRKWTCPPGYDLYAMGADPAADCTESTNGVTFELRLEGNPALLGNQTTGDAIDGGVVFSDLEPDVYNIAELLPDGIATAFVLECTGHLMGMLQPYPLQFGPVLDDIDLDAGEHLTCHWFNVPEGEGADLTLIKYTCSTEEFVSEVDCQIEEDGRTFDLLFWTGTWDLVDTGTTDGTGRIGWTGLAGGEYWFAEHDGEWCHIASDNLHEDGPWVVVPSGEETVVHVYNCDGTPGEPGETPTKYPNTGVPVEPTAAAGRQD